MLLRPSSIIVHDCNISIAYGADVERASQIMHSPSLYDIIDGSSIEASALIFRLVSDIARELHVIRCNL